MTHAPDTSWSKPEETIAQAAFEKAFEREREALLAEVRERAGAIAQLDDLWQLHDFLSARRHDIDGKYDYQDSALVFILSRLVKEGWLRLEELHGLAPSKLAKIAALTRM